MTDIDPPSLSPQAESYGEEVSYPSDAPSSEESSNSSASIITFYKPPTILSLLRSTAINLILPFINGVMLGFGEIFAHELAFRWGWRGAKVCSHFLLVGRLLMNRYIPHEDRRDWGLKYGGRGSVLRGMGCRGMRQGNNGMREDNWEH